MQETKTMGKEVFEITEEKTPGSVKFIIKGRLNAVNADEFQEKLQKALNEGHKDIVLDMYRVDFLSSAGIRVILKIYQEAHKSGGKIGIFI